MKRVLSWLVLAIGDAVFAFVAGLLVYLAFKLFYVIYYNIETLFWVLVVLEGITFIGMVITGIMLGCKAVVTCSQSVWKSTRGVRYFVSGIPIVLLYLAVLIGLWADIVLSDTPYMTGTFFVVMIAYGFALMAVGKDAVREDGLPPTKREQLEAKLAALDKKEQERISKGDAAQMKARIAELEQENAEVRRRLAQAEAPGYLRTGREEGEE